MPPSTDEIVHIKAYKKAFVFFARVIGIKIISGGIGKKELSAKDIMLRNQVASLREDFSKVQSYSCLNIFMINKNNGRSRGNRTHTTEVTGF